LEVAALALLLEIARADHNNSSEELAAIATAARRVFNLDSVELERMLPTAEVAVENSVSLFDFTEVLNRQLDHPTKRRLLEQLWRVAYADGKVDHYEEYYLRKIADLLYLGHSDFIQAKLRAAPT
jgi:uncharacterized tellurite resistance protein B-like protein